MYDITVIENCTVLRYPEKLLHRGKALHMYCIVGLVYIWPDQKKDLYANIYIYTCSDHVLW